MPTNNQIRNELAQLTCLSFAYDLVLTKTNYKQADANKLILRSLISYHNLPLIDEIYLKVVNSETNISTATLLTIMKDVWSSNASLRSKMQKDIIVYVYDHARNSSIGRNQAIELLLEAIKAHSNG